MTSAQRKALTAHRHRRRENGVVRLEVQVPAADVTLVRELAVALRGEPEMARDVRAKLQTALAEPDGRSVLDVFGSDLPDEYFEGVFDEDRKGDVPGDIDL